MRFKSLVIWHGPLVSQIGGDCNHTHRLCPLQAMCFLFMCTTGLVEIINIAGLLISLCRWMQMQGACGVCALLLSLTCSLVPRFSGYIARAIYQESLGTRLTYLRLLPYQFCCPPLNSPIPHAHAQWFGDTLLNPHAHLIYLPSIWTALIALVLYKYCMHSWRYASRNFRDCQLRLTENN